MTEPFYIAQNRQLPERHKSWIEKHVSVAKQEGATFFRASTHPDDDELVLLEGWKEYPGDQGELRWSFETK